MTERTLFLEAAARIGHRLVARAHRQGDVCAWPADDGAVTGTLYRGSAGTALFLAELARLSGDCEVARTAEAGMRHALGWAAGGPRDRAGFFTGRLGVAYAAARAGALLGCEALTAPAPAAIRAAASAPPPTSDDVIDGAAGMVLALLLLEPWAGDADAKGAAASLGRHLLARAVPEPWGWSWPAEGPHAERNLLGYAHGASGIGHALLELAAATGEAAFRHGAEQAWAYERRFFHPPAGNWPDFRHPPTASPEARGAVLPRFLTAWCHGAGGIGLARARALTLLGGDPYRRELEVAVAALRTRPREAGFNFSLCHGAGGTIELFLRAAEALGDPALREAALALAAEGCHDFELAGRPWPRVGGGDERDSALMVGEAGVGYCLLRLADPKVPSVLLPTPAGTTPPPPAGGPEVQRLRVATVEAYFPTTLAVFPRLARGAAYAPPPAAGPLSDPHTAYLTLARRVRGESDPAVRARLEDAFTVERTAYEATLGALYLSEERWERGDDAAEPDWEAGWLRLTGLARPVETTHDWNAWRDRPRDAPLPGPAPTVHLLVRADNRVRAHRLAPLTAAVVAALTSPRTLDVLLARVAAAFPAGEAPDPGVLRGAVLAQLRSLRALGAVAVDAAPPPARALGRLDAACRGEGDPAPPTTAARAGVARLVEQTRALLRGDPLLARMVAASVPGRTRTLLRPMLAVPLFEPLLAACERAPDEGARRAAVDELLDVLENGYGTGEMVVPIET